MYLKSLEIHGFKSFADKTLLEFAEGVTGIVGPNGCGKSNVVDAIRWVLGETSAKALRGGEMADVIFNGTEKRKPLGMAEVTLTMADCEQALKVDYSEVSITRRVFRDGKSEYRINGTLCRLKDIHDLFMDTGIGRTAYSIMAQGQIDQILSSKPEERRAVFEEAAGITKFKKEKKEALRKLEYTEANLLRVSDVLAEQERRMNSLKRQVAKARRYQALAADTRVLDTHLSHRKFVELTAERAELTTSMRGLEASECELERQLPTKEEAVNEARAAARSFEGELAELRAKLNEHRNAFNSAQGRIAFNEERKTELEARIRQNHDDISATREKLQQQEFDFIAANEALDQLNRLIAEKELNLSEQDSRSKDARQQRETTASSLRDTRAEANRTQSLIAALQAKIESAIAQLDGTRQRARELADEEQRLTLEIEEHRAVLGQISSQVDQAAQQITGLEEAFQATERSWQHTRGDLDAARSAAVESHQNLTRRSARLEAVRQLVESGEGFEKGTRHVILGLDEPERFKPTIQGALASLIEAENSSARAIESALGSHLHAVLVQDHTAAEAVISRLTEKKLGMAAVLPENFVPRAKGTQMEALPDGAVAWALDRVKSDPRVAGVVERLLENVLIVPDLGTALKLRPSHLAVTFVTLQGELLGDHGMIRGGATSDAPTSVLELRNEMRELENEVNSLTEADQIAHQRVKELEAQLEAQREQMEAGRERLQRQRVELSTLQGQHSLAKREVENIEAKIKNVAGERVELEGR
ncbi:MAG: chromosome segregation protein SMC [Luteolibacter sp.]